MLDPGLNTNVSNVSDSNSIISGVTNDSFKSLLEDNKTIKADQKLLRGALDEILKHLPPAAD